MFKHCLGTLINNGVLLKAKLSTRAICIPFPLRNVTIVKDKSVFLVKFYDDNGFPEWDGSDISRDGLFVVHPE